MKLFFSLVLITFLVACTENISAVNKVNAKLSVSDKKIKTQSEVNETLQFIATEIKNSKDIDSCEHTKKIIASGEKMLPFLRVNFLDSTQTTIFSEQNERNLSKGELAIIIASEIKRIPIAYVVGIQQCTPPFDFDVENFLYAIKRNPGFFLERYDIWLKEK